VGIAETQRNQLIFTKEIPYKALTIDAEHG